MISFAIGALVLALFRIAPSTLWTWGALVLIVGCCTGGAQFALTSLVASAYPSTILATATGWASGIARVGGVVSPLAGGALIGAGVHPTILSMLALPALICSAAMILLSRTPAAAAT